jgi:predicted O-methyltransferase YrrM
MIPPGPVSDHVQGVLSEFPVYRDYCAGRISRDKYLAGLDEQAVEIKQRLGDSEHLVRLASLYPPDFDEESDEIFDTLLVEGFVLKKPPAQAFDAFREKVRAAYDHGEHHTYIQPDEARLLYFLSMALKPKRVVAVGSYYGYWAIWAMPGVMAAGGQAVLIDPDAEVCALAEKNFRALGYGESAVVRAKKAEDVFPQIPRGIDLALLDADGGRDNPDPAYHGKGIYGFLVEGIFDRMRDDALLVVHNDYAEGPRAASLERFHAFCRDNFRTQHVAETPEGFGVYLK